MFAYKINKLVRYSYMKILLIILSFFSFHTSTKAGNSFGFLNRTYSPRVSALAGAYTAYYGDVNGIFVNPAGLAYIENNQLCMSYIRHLLDFNGGMIGFTHPMSIWGNLSIGIITFDYGNFEQIDKYGIYTGRNFSARDMAVAVSYANYLTDQFAYGITVKFILSEIDQYKAAANAIDIGFLYRSTLVKGNSIGLTLLNWGNNFDPYQEIRENLPITLAVGISQKFSDVPVTFNLSLNHALGENNYSIDKSLAFSLGSEISLLENLNIRLGYDIQKRKDLSLSSNDSFAGFSFGFGLNFENNSLDYSYNHYGALGLVHHFGFTFNFTRRSIRKILLKQSPMHEMKSLNPPEDVKMTLTSNNIIITWQYEKDMAYNLYVRNARQSEWIKLNDKPLLKDMAKLKKSYFEGKYDFAVTTIEQYTESELSKPVSIHIKSKSLDKMKSLNPPEDVRMTLTSKNIIIFWKYEKDAAYNLYIRYSNRSEWKKINNKPLSENIVKLKKSKLRGKYDFAVTKVNQNVESDLSKSLSININ
jgi:hypothetical protein